MARSTRRSKPDQRGAETLGGLPARLHAIRKVGFDQLVRENACKGTAAGPCHMCCLLFPLEGLEKNLYFDAAERQAARRRQESSVKCGCASTVEGARAADLSAITADIRIRSRGVLYSSTSTVVSTRSLCPSTCLECPIVFVPVSSSPSCAWNLARGSVVVDCGYSEGHFHSIRQRFHACFLDIRDRKLAARTVSSKHVAMHSVVSMSSSFSVVSGVGFVE